MYRKILLSSFHNGKVEYCTTFGSGDIEENASAIFFTQTLLIFNSVSVRRNVIFGGDLNMRDKELAEVGGIPPGTKDCWQHCGAREVAKYTWDMTRFVP